MTELQIKAVMLGHAVADALGVPVEFSKRKTLNENPVTDMRGYGTYGMPAGSWSDDTSMALCALDVLAKGYLDLSEIMSNFGRWRYNGEFTPTGVLFDIGGTCAGAISNYFDSRKNAYSCGLSDLQSNGNGSLMRIHPFVLYLAADSDTLTLYGIDRIFEASALTHAHMRSKLACGIYAFVLMHLLKSPCKQSIRDGLAEAYEAFKYMPELEHYSRIFEADFAQTPIDGIKSSGYVVDTLEASLWCLLSTDSYSECVLKAVNLGGDTDTVGAIAGGLAGALYGYDAIPQEWLSVLLKRDSIEAMCSRAYEKWSNLEKHEVADLHIHIVPDIDDGAINLEMALDMLKASYEQGVRRMFCTSHNEPRLEYTAYYRTQLATLKELARDSFPELCIYSGNEVYCEEAVHSVIERLREGTYLTLGDTPYVLCEFNRFQEKDSILRCVTTLKSFGYKPIVAHAERYDTFDDEDFIRKLISSGAFIQINVYSLVEEQRHSYKYRARSMLKSCLVHFIGSDAHRSTHRPPRLLEGVRYIYSTVDKAYADAVCFGNARKITEIACD